MSEEHMWINAVPYQHEWTEEDREPIEGIYHGKIQVEGDHEQKFWVYLLRSERGFEKLVGRNQLDKAMELIPLGNRVRVTNLGLQPISNGMNERQFEVLICIDGGNSPLSVMRGLETLYGTGYEFTDDGNATISIDSP